MYGIKARANGVEQINWVDNDERVARLCASLAMQATINRLKGLEGDFDVIEETDNFYAVRGARTGFEFSVEVIKA